MNLNNSIFRKTNNYLFLIGIVSIIVLFLIYFLIPFKFNKITTDDEVIISYADNISPAHQIVVDRFNDEYKGRIRVETINLPFRKFSTNERKELLTRSLRSKSDKLDIFAIDLIWSARFAKWSEPLDKYIVKTDTMNLIHQALESCIINNSLVALPMYLDIGAMYYRKDLIENLPNYKIIEKKLRESITWEDFFELSNSFKSSTNPFYTFPADNYEGLVCSFVEILLNQNDSFFLQKPFNWKSDEVRNSLLILTDMINKYKITPPIVTDYRENNSYDYYLNNQGVFLRGWASFPKDAKNLIESNNLDTLIEQVALPHLKGSRPMSTIGGWNIMLSKYSENKKEAIEFIKFILKEETQKTLYEYGAFLPVLSNLYTDEKFIADHPELINNKKLLENGVHRPFLDNYTKISDVISFYANKALKGQLSVESAIELTNQSLISGELILR